MQPTEREKWNCDFCLERKLFKERNCPLGVENWSEEQENALPVSDGLVARAKYGFSKKPQKVESGADTEMPDPSTEKPKRYVIKHGSFEFYECPVPMVTENLMTSEDRFANFVTDMVDWSEATGTMPVDGGLLEQANVFFQARKIILIERAEIDKERREEQEANSKKNSKTPRKRR